MTLTTTTVTDPFVHWVRRSDTSRGSFDLASLRRVAVLRANGLGDFLFATPALRALSHACPEAEITYLCQPWLQPFIEGRFPYVHRTLVVPPYPGIRSGASDPDCARREADRFFAFCQSYSFDLAIQMHGGGVESNPFVRQIGARHTLGLAGLTVPPLDRSLVYHFYQHEVLRYLELVAQIGVPSTGLHLDAPEVAGDAEKARSAWPDLDRADFVIIHPGASDVRRRWPIERFAAVADYVWRVHGKQVVVTGGPTDRPLASALCRSIECPVIDLSGQLDLGAMVALVRRADLVICNDTGVAHLAYASDTPNVVVYWCGNVITAGPFGRAQSRPVLSWTLECPACGKRSCHCQVSFVADATLDEVIGQVDDLLAT